MGYIARSVALQLVRRLFCVFVRHRRPGQYRKYIHERWSLLQLKLPRRRLYQNMFSADIS